ncbi:MAG: cell division ATP-binding protein FtsE [Pseudohongiellaceae bacterium]
MIKFEKVFKRYPGGFEALSDVSFSVGKGELAFVTGHSGAGKSTLLKLILAMESVSSGNISIAGTHLQNLSRGQIPLLRQKIGSVFQDHQLLLRRSVAENVALPLKISHFPKFEADRRVRAALDKVGLLDKASYFPTMLSTGEQQRVGIARAVVNRPQIILADEPTGNLDPELSAEIMQVFQQFQKVGVSLLIASHDIGLIDRMGCRKIVLEKGRLVS